MKKELFEGLTEEQIARAKECDNPEELLRLAREEGIELSDEQLAAVSGGMCSDTEVKSVCPKCGTEVTKEAYNDSYNELYVKFTCPNCGNKWDDRFKK